MSLRAPAWAWFAVAAGVALFAVLGTWQLNRGLGKQAWLERFDAGSGSVMTLGAGVANPGPYDMRQALARGRYEAGRQLLQDGQSHEGRPGFHVWTPMRLAAGGLLVVNRGWIPQPAQLEQLPNPAGPTEPVEVSGWWRSLPEPGIRVGDSECRAAESFPQVVVYPTAEQLACLLGEPVLGGLLLLDPQEAGGFVRQWRNPGLPPERHFGYAVTWYALGVTAIFLFLKLNLKRE